MLANFEIITTTDKAQRDHIFEQLKTGGNDLEKQVVKFSDCEPVIDPTTNEQEVHLVWYEKSKNLQLRPVYRSTWSVGYPKD